MRTTVKPADHTARRPFRTALVIAAVALGSVAPIVVSAATGTSSAVAAANVLPKKGRFLTPVVPEYTVKVLWFTALDESGEDDCYAGVVDSVLPGDQDCSDEPYWIFSTVNPAGSVDTTAYPYFDDVDSGETHHFFPNQGCLWPSNCTSAPAPNGISTVVQLWEEDDSGWQSTVDQTREVLKTLQLADVFGSFGNKVVAALGYLSGVLKDDHIQTHSFRYDTAFLAKHVPNVGNQFIDASLFTDGDADYKLVVSIQRVR